jgi:chitodextrinase
MPLLVLKLTTVTGLTSSTDYTFTVKSKDKAGNLSDASNDETITTKPSAPTNLQAQQLHHHQQF